RPGGSVLPVDQDVFGLWPGQRHDGVGRPSVGVPMRQQWPVDGIPRRPGAWLWTVARRRAVDVLRRDVLYREKLAQVAWPAEPAGEDARLGLIFPCCPPACRGRRRWR